MTVICKELKGVKVKEINKEAMEVSLTHNKNKWKIVTLYIRNIEEILEVIMEKIQEKEEGHLIMGENFNARTGGGEPVGDQERRNKKREEDQRIRR